MASRRSSPRSTCPAARSSASCTAVTARPNSRSFLDRIEQEVPAHLDVHVSLDNYGTHKTPAIQRWPVRHPRFHFHVTPAYSSWINQVERWFAALTEKQLRPGTHRSSRELEDDPPLPRHQQREPQALRLGEDGRSDPRERPPIL